MKPLCFATLENMLSAALPLTLWRKMFHFLLRTSSHHGADFVTYHRRPKFAGYVARPDGNLAKSRPIAVVMQGPLELRGLSTLETARLYKWIFPMSELIVSTWNGEDPRVLQALANLGVHIVLNDPPQIRGIKNLNCQLVSARTGVEKAAQLNAEYVLKTRTDQRIYAPNALSYLVNLVKTFPVTNKSRQRGRIVGASLGSFKYGLYHLSDMTQFGYIEDMQQYWSPPLSIQDRLPDGMRDVMDNVREFDAPEQYLATNFLRAVGHDVQWTLEDSWRAFAAYFCIADRHALDLAWCKYAPYCEHKYLRYDGIAASSPMTFLEWFNIYSGLHNKSDMPRYEAIRELSFHDKLTPPNMQLVSTSC